MPKNKDPEVAYPDLHTIMDAALDSENGVSIDFAEWKDADGNPHDNPAGAAWRARHACYQIRMRDRQRSKEIYDPDHPKYGRSPYDELTFRWRKGSSVLEIYRGDQLLKNIKMRDPVTGEELN